MIGKDEDTCPPSLKSFGAAAAYAQGLRRAKDFAFYYGVPRRSLAANVFGILKNLDPTVWLRRFLGEAIKGKDFSRHTFESLLFKFWKRYRPPANRKYRKGISEYDGEDLFFGYAIIGNPAFAEWGYVSFTELKQIRIPPGIEVDCEFLAPPLKASEIEEIRIR